MYAVKLHCLVFSILLLLILSWKRLVHARFFVTNKNFCYLEYMSNGKTFGDFNMLAEAIDHEQWVLQVYNTMEMCQRDISHQ